MKKTLTILHQSNDGYSAICGTSIISLLENNKALDEIHIYYLEYKLSRDNIEKLKALVKPYSNTTMTIIDAQKYHDELKELGVQPWRGLYITWLKLLAISDLKVNTDRILYINAHTIVNGSLDELISFDFEDTLLGLSYDCILNDHKAAIGLAETAKYYNCGVMLINYRQWIKDNVGATIRERLREKSDYVIVDQDFCNIIFQNKIKLLGATYNFSSAYYAYDLKRLLKTNDLSPEYFYSYDELMGDYYAPKIIHSLFGITGKPWELNSKHPQRFLWRKYLAMTPWRSSEMPTAKYNINWFLYDILPAFVFMRVYKFGVKSKYGKEKRNKLIVKLFDLFTPQKGT